MRKSSSVLISICFAILSMVIVSGCSYTKSMFGGIEEDTLGGSMAGRGSGQSFSENFARAPGSFDLREFNSLPQLQPIHFDYDLANIKPRERDILSRNAAWIIDHPGTVVRIEGHADERGTLDYNLALGDRRATSTRSFLISLGVEPSRIITISYGEEKPSCNGSGESCWSKNRRAEFLLSS